jgi:hypothetical protein
VLFSFSEILGIKKPQGICHIEEIKVFRSPRDNKAHNFFTGLRLIKKYQKEWKTSAKPQQ